MVKIKVTLLTGRTIDQGTSKEHGKLSKEHEEKVAICEVDSSDLKKLAAKKDSNVKVSSRYGSVVVKAVESKRGPHPGIIYMPYGLWANMIVDPHTHGTGMPSFKGIPAELEAAPEECVMSILLLLERTFGKKPK
ncbi:molybdopterin dinucleotide-binding protein [Candidatus Bathyarchaeota archaeon]|nr:molybdopterin dinucleotide-binding protein [Candidatus Bathyarchaeota archaeon]